MKLPLNQCAGRHARVADTSFVAGKKLFIYLVIGSLFVSALTVTTATTAKAATVGSGVCEQTVGSNVGVSVIQDGNDCVVTFTDGSTTWTPPTGVTAVRALVVGGGGGGGAWVGGGGGAGGFRDVSSVSVTPGTPVSLSVGAGGTPASVDSGSYSQFGTNGGNSIFGSITATGGGKGASHAAAGLGGLDRKALAGGSGGGGTGSYGATNDDWPMLIVGGEGNTPSTTPAQGSNGGNGYNSTVYTTGGGGGAGSAGGSGTSTSGGNGGAGLSSDITGVSVFYAGGGGGINYGSASGAGTGGAGGGGAGVGTGTGISGSANTGGGGGGGGSNANTSTGGSGGSGVVIIRYATTPAPQNTPAATASPSSAPSTSTPTAVATKSTANLGKSIRFSTSSKVLTAAHKNTLKKSVKTSGKDATYVVTGTAGFLPGVTEAQVKKLANVRANTVKAYLVKLGVNKANITIKINTTNQGIVPKTKTLARYLTL